MKGSAKYIIRLATIRQAHGLTQQELADASGVSRVTIARIETDRINPTVQILQRIADTLGVTLDELVDRKAG